MLAVGRGVESAVHVGDGAEVLQEQRAGQVVMVVRVVHDLGRGRAEVGDPAAEKESSVFGTVVKFIGLNFFG